jgi:uncharacterized damage-inducible protein DinB
MTSTQEQLCATFQQERQILLDALKPLSDEQLDAKGVVGAWSIKNVLAHLTAWEKAVVGFLPDRIATGQRPVIFDQIGEDEDGWNEKTIRVAEHLSPQGQLAAFTEARADLLRLIQSLDEATLSRDHPWSTWDGTVAEYLFDNVGGHEQEHREAILVALAPA